MRPIIGQAAPPVPTYTLSGQVYNKNIPTGNLTVTPGSSGGARAYTPDHWIQFQINQEPFGTSGTSQGERALAAAPHLKGAMRRRFWKSMEPTLGSYDFSGVDADLRWCADNGIKYMLFFQDKSFPSDSGGIQVPVGLEAYVSRTVTATSTTNPTPGYCPWRWNSNILNAQKNFMTALKNHISAASPNYYSVFDGVAIPESAPSMSQANYTASGYDPSDYGDYFIDLLSHCATTFPTKRAQFWFNFLPSFNGESGSVQIDRILDDTTIHGTFWAGGPDCWPNSTTLKNGPYPKYAAHQTDCPLVVGISDESYEQTADSGTGLMPMQEVFEFGRDYLHVQRMVWIYRASSSTRLDFINEGAAVVEANQTFHTQSW